MLATLAFVAALQKQGRPALGLKLTNPNGGPSRATVMIYMDRMPTAKLSPKKFGDPPIQWEFDFNAAAFAELQTAGDQHLRFSIYSQERKGKDDRAGRVGQMLLRLWEHNYNAFKLDHNLDIKGGVIDVYLCFGGKAGGEQLFGSDAQSGTPTPVNMIYIYDLASFSEPIEMAREIAHEYGHATLPAIGGFKTPEDWANGYLGEKIFLTWARDEMQAGRLAPDDMLGATKEKLDTWVKRNVDPLILRGGLYGPAALVDTGTPTMDAYLGFVMAQNAILPPACVGRALRLTGSTNPKDVPEAFAMAIQELESFKLKIPTVLKGNPFWVATAGRAIKGAKTVGKSGKWRKLIATTDIVDVGGPVEFSAQIGGDLAWEANSIAASRPKLQTRSRSRAATLGRSKRGRR